MKDKKLRRVLIGHVGVDSGQLMICDPSYIGSEWKKNKEYNYRVVADDAKNEFSYQGASDATAGGKRGGQMFFKKGHYGAGVAFCSGYGDGVYPVYATYNEDGRVIKVEVEME